MNEEAASKGLIGTVFARMVPMILVVGVIVFLPAGSFGYWNGWLYFGAIILPMCGAFVYLYRKDPELLAKRMKTKEKEKAQRWFVILSIVLLLSAFVVPGLDFRHGWSTMPPWVSILAAVVMVGGYFMFVVAMAQNSYASRVVEIQEGQRLVDTGLYGVVRHPMYFAATILYLATPLVLGSWFALIPMVFFPLLLAFRILDEERVLREGLPGYVEYCERVRFRLIPFLW